MPRDKDCLEDLFVSENGHLDRSEGLQIGRLSLEAATQLGVF